MSAELEHRLRTHFARLADEAELPPERVDEVIDPPVALAAADTTVGGPGRWRSALLVAAVAVGLLAGLGAVLGRSTDGDVAAPVDVGVPLSDVDALSPDDWVVASRLPDGLVYMYAFEAEIADTGAPRSVRYGNERVSGTFERMSISAVAGAPPEGEPVVVDGTTWAVDDPLTGGWTAERRVGDVVVTVADSGAFDAAARDLLAGLVVVPPEGLPAGPLGDEDEAVVVARTPTGAAFTVQESLGYWWTRIEGAGGCCSRIDTDDDGITLDERTSEMADGAATARVLVAGTVRPGARWVRVEFADGTVAETEPTDLSGRFDREFWVVEVTVPSEDLAPVEVGAYDEDGRLLYAATR